MTRRPPLTIALPVRNGAAVVEAAARALLAQTFTDFELVIVDGGSTDATPDIARRLAGEDHRVRLVAGRPDGAPNNFNAAAAQARGRYVKWAADDDLHHPEFVERCVRVLEAEPDAVAAYTRARSVDDGGRVLRAAWGHDPGLGSTDPVERFRTAMAPPRDPIPLVMFAVIRTEVLARTGMLWPVPEFDLALVAELALHGRLVEVDEVLFDHLEHGDRLGPALAAGGDERARLLGRRSPLPHWQLLVRHLSTLARAPRPVDRRAVAIEIARWTSRRRAELARDVPDALTSLPVVGRPIARRRASGEVDRFARRTARFRRLIDDGVPREATVVVIDDDVLGLSEIGGRACRPLQPLEAPDGSIPAGDGDAIAALDRRIDEGATHLAVAWTARWVLDYHQGFARHLQRHHRLLDRADESMIWELRSEPADRSPVSS